MRTPSSWTSAVTFSLVAVGGAVGLGSIWRFPYLAGTSGGSAFIFVFVLACVLIAMPLLVAEFLIGRRSRACPPLAAGIVAREAGASSRWNVIGALGTIAAFVIISYYTLIAGWVMAYTWKTARGQLVGLDRPEVAALWRDFLADPVEMGAWHVAFLAIVAFISARGLARGLEAANWIRAPSLLILLLVLVGYSLATGDVGRGLAFAFAPNFSAITPNVALTALGQAFYATGVGLAMMIAFGSYTTHGTSLVRTSLIIIGSILLVSLLATLMVFPMVFRYGMDPAQGPALVFDVLATVFAEMPGGRLAGTLFFLLLTLAALTPSLAGIEPTVAWLEQRHGMTRQRAALVAVAACWLLGIGSVLSFNLWADWRPLGFVPGEGVLEVFGKMTFFDVMDQVSSNLLLPLGALFTSLFVGWRLNRALVLEELAETTPLARRTCVWLVRWVCPAAILAIMVSTLV